MKGNFVIELDEENFSQKMPPKKAHFLWSWIKIRNVCSNRGHTTYMLYKCEYLQCTAWLEDVRFRIVLEYIESMLNIKLLHWQSKVSYEYVLLQYPCKWDTLVCYSIMCQLYIQLLHLEFVRLVRFWNCLMLCKRLFIHFINDKLEKIIKTNGERICTQKLKYCLIVYFIN